jgi:hypothetical protein
MISWKKQLVLPIMPNHFVLRSISFLTIVLRVFLGNDLLKLLSKPFFMSFSDMELLQQFVIKKVMILMQLADSCVVGSF